MDTAGLVIALTRAGAGTLPRDWAASRLPASVDWPAVLDLARQHRVAPLLAEALRAAPAGSVPPAVHEQVAEEVWRAEAARLLCEHALGALLATLAAHDIEAIVLKGAALAHTLYPRPELRPYHDLDLLFRPADLRRLRAVLTAAGYREEASCLDPAAGADLPLGAVPSYLAPPGNVALEVHVDALQLGLAARHRSALWDTARPVRAGDLSFRAPMPLHQLLHLAAHVHRHDYSRLLWLLDLDLLVRRQGAHLDWPAATALARDEGLAMLLRHALATAHSVLGTPRPPLPAPAPGEAALAALYRRLWPASRVRRLGRRERRRLLRFAPESGDPRDMLYGLVLLGRRRDKWRHLRGGGGC